MKIKCKVCRKETEINELVYSPGDRISIECARCGNELEVIIPEREEELSVNTQPKSTKQGFVSNGEDSIMTSSIISSKEDLESIWYAAGSSKTADANIEDKRTNKDTLVVVSTAHEQVSSNSSSKSPNLTSSTLKPTSSAITTYSSSNIGKRSKSKDTPASGRIMFFIIFGIICVVGSLWLLHNEHSNPHNSKPTYSYGYGSDSAEVTVQEVAEIMDYSEDTAIDETGVIDYETQNANDTYDSEFFHQGHGYITTKSGLKYVTVIEGSGASPSEDAVVTVHYNGMLTDGTIFDSSYERGEPASFPLKMVIKGWTEGLQYMKVGEKAVFYIPSHLAYGEQGTPGGPIGPNEDLIFEVELLGIDN